MKTVVVLPTYNEARNIAELVADLLALDLGELKIVIVDDNSPDGTGWIADRLVDAYSGQVHVLHRSHKLGLGSAYQEGFRYALHSSASLVVQMDADFSHAPSSLPLMVQKAQECDVVVGSRYVPEGSIDKRWGLWRQLLSRLGNFYARQVTGLKVRDVTSGFKVFRREVLENISLDQMQSQGYAFLIEIAYACQQAGYRVCEVPIFFADRAVGSSKMDLRVILEAIWRVWQIRFRRSP